jgi:plasmid maintenance system antidote protein VapI
MAALNLAETLGTFPKLWMNLQATYDLDKASQRVTTIPDGFRQFSGSEVCP